MGEGIAQAGLVQTIGWHRPSFLESNIDVWTFTVLLLTRAERCRFVRNIVRAFTLKELSIQSVIELETKYLNWAKLPADK